MNQIVVGEAVDIVDCCTITYLSDVLLTDTCQVPHDPDIVLGPQRNGCRVEIIGGVAHTTSLDVCSLFCFVNYR